MGAQPEPHASADLKKEEEFQYASPVNEDQAALDLASLPADNPPPYSPPSYEAAIQDQSQFSHCAEFNARDEKNPSGLTHQSSDEQGEPSWRIGTPELPPRLRDATDILSKPIALPTVRSAQGSPYIRGYPLELAKVGITRERFLSFLDHVNRVVADNPPLVAVGLIGSVVGLVPEPTTQLAGTVIELAANATNVALAEGRTELVLRKANNDIFHPVGLQVRVAKLEAVAKIAGMPFLDTETGKLTSGLRVLAPLDDEMELHTLDVQRRRLRDLEEWLSPLDLEQLPEVERPSSVMGKMHVKMSEFQRKMEEEELMKMRKKSLGKYTEAKQSAQERYERKMRDLDRRVEKMGQRAGKDGRKQSTEEETLREEKNMDEAKEQRDANKREEKDLKQEAGEISRGSSNSQVSLDRFTTEDSIREKCAKREEKERKKQEKRAEKEEKRAEKEERRAEKQEKRAEKEERRVGKEEKKAEERKKKEVERAERENRRREEKGKEIEKKAKRAEEKIERALTRAEEKRVAIRDDYEKELKKRSDKYEKKDKEERAIKKINWLIITERNRMERSLVTGVIPGQTGS
ncbi:unnamed protein product [Clonostachys rosea]|uniref:SMC hinge domain-containing protein n=1 Tax=Bionectria ochroleuca TaxID=29856 RepID=A0ABY6UY52_BIOOC|nr:unnamed protein product [Clonostachys rosea]